MWSPPYSNSREREIEVKGKGIPFRQVTQSLLLTFPDNQLFRLCFRGIWSTMCPGRRETWPDNQPSTPPLPTSLFQKASLPAVHTVYYLLFTDKLQLDHILINDLLWPSYLQIFFLWFQIIRWLGIRVELSFTRREENWCHPRNEKLLGVPKIKLRWGQFPLHWLHNHPAIHIIQNKWLDSL